MTEFCFNTYLPEAREATRNILPLPDEEKSKLKGNIFEIPLFFVPLG